MHDGATGDGLDEARRDGVQREDLPRRVPQEYPCGPGTDVAGVSPCGPGTDVAGVSPCGPGADVGTDGRTRGDSIRIQIAVEYRAQIME